MGTHKVNLIKINNNWLVDFAETELIPKIDGVSQQHFKHLIGGWDSWLEIVSDGSDNFWMIISDSPILNGTEIKQLNKTNIKENYNGRGTSFIFKSYKGISYDIEFWSCLNGFEFTFGEVPSSWYFIKHD